MAYTERRGYRRTRRTVGSLLLRPLALFLAVALAAATYVAYVLWPRWPGDVVATDAPSLPITIAGVTFNVPPAAIRIAVQRRVGAQERIDLTFLWPSLNPPKPPGKQAAPASPDAAAQKPSERLFVTIAPADGTLTPLERFKTIYPRYTASQPTAAAPGLTVAAFRNGTPYQGEELVYDKAAPEKFLARCSKDKGLVRGTCLNERRIGGVDITVRFPSDWLADWRQVAQGIDKLIANLRPSGG